MAKLVRMLILVLVIVGVGLGCSDQGTVAPECEVDGDCRGDQVCDLGICQVMPSVEGIGTGDSSGTGDGDDGDGDETATDGDGGVADGDVLVDGDGESDPTGDDNADGEGGDDGGDGTGDSPPEFCTMVGEACVPGTSSGAGLVCVPQGDGSGVCRATCGRAGHADLCAAGTYCLDGDGDPFCEPSECMTHADCNTGSCVLFDNDYRTCIPAGPRSPGESCLGGGERCQPGYFCDAPSDGLSGTCMPLCDPFGLSPCADPVDEACAIRWRRTGVCTTYPYLADTLNSFEECSAPSDWCTDAVECRASGTTAFCMPYCRPGEGDCEGELLPGGEQTLCDNYWFPGDQSLGLCTPPCATDFECGDAYDCVDQICRKPCPTGNPIAECCSGSMDCEYICEAGYCA